LVVKPARGYRRFAITPTGVSPRALPYAGKALVLISSDEHWEEGISAKPLMTGYALAVALSLGAGFVAREFSGDMEHLGRLIQPGMKHKGFSLIDILQPCVSFNRVNTYDWYKKRVHDLFEENYDPDDFENAINIARQWGEKIPIEIIYQKEKPTFIDRIEMLNQGPLISQKYNPERLQALLSGS
jgi:pyruvate/2-oxoacid:ferredoxin oxidoreductase beta subunit